MSILKRKVLTIDDNFYKVGYVEPDDWNGWAKPWFDFETSGEILNYSHWKWVYDKEKDAFGYLDEDGYWVFYAGEDLETEDGTLHLYPIGNCYWIWSIIDD